MLLNTSLKLAAATLAATGVVASGNGIASDPPAKILAAAQSAVNGVKSVHMTGDVASGKTKVALNLYVATGEGSKGSMSENGLSFQIITLGNKVYINASQAFWIHFGGKAAATLFKGKWLVAPATGSFGDFASLTKVSTLFSQLLATGNAQLVKAGTSTVDGQPVVGIRDTKQGGTLYVATTGKPYPIEISKPGSNGGQISFNGFNQPVAIKAPANAIDVSKLK